MSEDEKEQEITEPSEEPRRAAGDPEAEEGSLPEAENADEENASLTEDEETELEEEEEEEIEFDLEAQIETFRLQIEEEPENCIHHYNLGEALEELDNYDEAEKEFKLALQFDEDKGFSSIIHFGLGNLYYKQLMSGVQSNVIKSSVGLMSSHKQVNNITGVKDEDYEKPIEEFEAAIQDLNRLKADDDIVEYVSKNAPQQMANTYYKWASDLIDKSRQLERYGDEIKDVKQAIGFLKKTLEIDPNHSQATLMNKYAKRMVQEGWQTYDEYGFLAKEIPGTG